MIIRLFIPLLIIGFYGLPGNGQSRNSNAISGIAKEKSTGEALPYATVFIEGSNNGTTTNNDGFFTLFKQK